MFSNKQVRKSMKKENHRTSKIEKKIIKVEIDLVYGCTWMKNNILWGMIYDVYTKKWFLWFMILLSSTKCLFLDYTLATILTINVLWIQTKSDIINLCFCPSNWIFSKLNTRWWLVSIDSILIKELSCLYQ